MPFENIETSVGFMGNERYAIILHEIVFITLNRVRLTCEMMGESRTQYTCNIIFENVIHFQVSQWDVYETLDHQQYSGCFVEETDSKLVQQIKETGQYQGIFHHYHIWTYDYVFEIVAAEVRF